MTFRIILHPLLLIQNFKGRDTPREKPRTTRHRIKWQRQFAWGEIVICDNLCRLDWFFSLRQFGEIDTDLENVPSSSSVISKIHNMMIKDRIYSHSHDSITSSTHSTTARISTRSHSCISCCYSFFTQEFPIIHTMSKITTCYLSRNTFPTLTCNNQNPSHKAGENSTTEIMEVSPWKRIECFLSTPRWRNSKTKQLDLLLKKTLSGILWRHRFPKNASSQIVFVHTKTKNSSSNLTEVY